MTGVLPGLAIALAAGLIVGMERGWVGRAVSEGSRVTGVRTFALAGFLGGLSELLGNCRSMLFVLCFLAFALLMAVPLYVAALYFIHRAASPSMKAINLRNPLEIAQALKFAALLAVILLASKGLQQLWSPAGLYLAATAAGIADVDAITISIPV